MPELTEEQTRRAFALLRAESLAHMRPPGAEEAQRTVRRRRRTGIAAVAASVLIMVAGGATVANLVDPDRSAPPPTAPSPSPSSSALSMGQLDDLASAAASALGIDAVDNRKRRSEGKGPILMGSAYPVLRSGGGIGGTGSNENKTGVYVFEVLCVGKGTLRARFWAGTSTANASRNHQPPTASPDMQVPCSDEPIPATAIVRAPWPAMVYVSIEADQTAIGRAAYAFLVREP